MTELFQTPFLFYNPVNTVYVKAVMSLWNFKEFRNIKKFATTFAIVFVLMRCHIPHDDKPYDRNLQCVQALV